VGSSDFEFIRLRGDIAGSIASGHFRDANRELKELRMAQRLSGGNGLPSDFTLRSEMIYNDIFYPLAAAAVAFCAGMAGIFRRRKTAYAAGCAVFAYLTLIIILRWIAGGHVPLSTGFETMLIIAWLGVTVATTAGFRLPALLPTGLLLCGAALIVAMIGSRNPSVSPLLPVLSSRLLSLHVMLVLTAYALFAIIALNSICALAGRGKTDVSRFLLYPAVLFLAAGIFVGAIWADRSWGRYWGWDPKETWALITLFIYAFPLHEKSLHIFARDRNLNVYLIVAFLSVLMTYFGVNYLLEGLHSYGTQ
ncbi:MAG: cytochrome c biogenesis protein CcsA, partial [Duncaniella sp.]|nr:cytochrome c biogenesis protein CcsA [Duncaniella sp.]